MSRRSSGGAYGEAFVDDTHRTLLTSCLHELKMRKQQNECRSLNNTRSTAAVAIDGRPLATRIKRVPHKNASPQPYKRLLLMSLQAERHFSRRHILIQSIQPASARAASCSECQGNERRAWLAARTFSNAPSRHMPCIRNVDGRPRAASEREREREQTVGRATACFDIKGGAVAPHRGRNRCALQTLSSSSPHAGKHAPISAKSLH